MVDSHLESTLFELAQRDQLVIFGVAQRIQLEIFDFDVLFDFCFEVSNCGVVVHRELVGGLVFAARNGHSQLGRVNLLHEDGSVKHERSDSRKGTQRGHSEQICISEPFVQGRIQTEKFLRLHNLSLLVALVE